jgi:WD40 repeat protein
MVYASFSPDGKRLVSVSMSTSGCLWNVKSSKLINYLIGTVISATFSSDGSLLATGGADKMVRLSNGYSGALIKTLPLRYTGLTPQHTSPVNSVVFALFDTVIVSLSTSSMLRWTVAGADDDMKPIPMQGNTHTDLMMGMVVSHDSKIVATFANDMTVRLWDVKAAIGTGEPMLGPRIPCSAAFSIDDTRILVGYEGGNVIIWNATTQQPIHHLLHDTKTVYTIVMSPDKRIAAVCGGAFCLWDVDTGEMVCPPLVGHTHDVWGVAFNKDGNRMASGSCDKTMRIWNIRRTGGRIAVEGISLRGHTNYINHVSMTPDGRMLSSASGDGTVRLWDTDLLDHSDNHELPDQVHNRTSHLCLSGDKSRLLSAGDNGTLQMWDFTTGRKIGTLLQSQQGYLHSLCFSSCGKIWASGHTNGKVCLWKDGDDVLAPVLHTLLGQTPKVSCMALAIDGKKLATGSAYGLIQVWDTRNCSCVAEFKHSSRLCHIAISPDGTFIAAASDDEIKVWNLASHDTAQDPMVVIRSGPKYGPWMESMIFSPDETAIISNRTYKLELYDPYDNMRRFATFSSRDHEGEGLPYPTPTFSPDGRYLFYGPQAFDFANTPRLGHEVIFPAQVPEALAPNPISPLILMNRRARIYSTRWKEPILLIPPDINVDRGPWVAHKNTIAFGSYDGGVFIVRFPDEYM